MIRFEAQGEPKLPLCVGMTACLQAVYAGLEVACRLGKRVLQNLSAL